MLTFTAQPANNDTVTLDSSTNLKTYTFKTTLTGAANEVLIDTTTAGTIANLMNAIIAGPGAGTKYGTGTTAHATMTATNTSTTLTVTYKTAGSAGNGAPVSITGTSATWATTTLQGGANILTSAITPQGLQSRCKIYTTSGSFYSPGTTIHVIPQDRNAFRSGADLGGAVSGAAVLASTQFRIIANKYQFFHFAVGSQNMANAAFFMAMGCPWLSSNLTSPTVPAITTPNSINLPNHGFTTGQTVQIVGATGISGMPDTAVITVVDANNFTLNSVTLTGTYTANSAYIANLTLGTTVVEAIWATASNGGNFSSLRNAFKAQWSWTSVNTNAMDHSGGATGSEQLQCLLPVVQSTGDSTPVQFSNNTYLIYEPFLCWGVAISAQAKLIGQIWDSACVRFAVPLEQAATFDSPTHNFIAVCLDSTNNWAMFVAVT